MTRAEEPDDPNERRLIDPRTVERVRFSTLRELAKSPAHYLDACQRKHDEEGEDSQRLGSAAHALLLGTPDVVVFGPGTFEGKEYKGQRAGKYWDAFELEHRGKIICTPAEHAKAKAISDAIRRHPIAGPLLFAPGTKYEWEAEWTYCGRKMVSHIDAYRYVKTEDKRPVLIDIKTSRDGSPDRFAWSAIRYHYFAQLACYTEAAEDLGHPTPEPYIIVVENTRPYVVTVMRLDDDAIEFGRRQLRGWMETLLRHEAAGVWPGYSQCVETLSVPGERLAVDVEEEET